MRTTHPLIFAVLLCACFAGTAAAEQPKHPALVSAIRHHDADAVRTTIDAGANVDDFGAELFKSYTPLSLAAREGTPEIVQLLLEHGATAGADGAFVVAMSHQEPADAAKIARLLLEAKIKPTPDAMHTAASEGQAEVVALLLERGASPTEAGSYSHTPLHGAAEGGHPLIALALIDRGAQIDARENYEVTPLHLAALSGNLTLIELLLDHGADINATSKSESLPNPLAIAVAAHAHHRPPMVRTPVVELLLDRGATPTLSALAATGRTDAMRPLLENPDAFKPGDAFGHTPLHAAALHGQTDAVRLLLQADHPVSPATKHGHTPLHYAAAGNHLDVAQALVEAGADIEAKLIRDLFVGGNFTPLHEAIANGQHEMAKLLIELGADPDASVDRWGTPRQMMEQSKNPHLRGLASTLPRAE